VTFEGELATLLERENAILTDLAECAHSKTNMIAKGDVSGLTEMVNREQPLVMHLQSMETKRNALFRKYQFSGKTLREICTKADTEYKEILEARLETLSEAAEKLKERNSFNNELTKSRLEFYGKMRALLAKPVPGYDQEISHQRTLIDKTI
jgi:flagellar biosynthesis/type III secretory pathway chaperone